MKTTFYVIGILVLGFFLLTTAVISPAVGETNKSGGDEGPVMETSGTASFGTEDWVGTMESSEALGAGTIPESAR